MSTQPTSIILGPRYGTAADEPAASDLQHVIGRVLKVLSRRRWLFAFPLLTGMLISLIASLGIPRRYVLSTIFERRDDEVITNLINTNSPYSFTKLRPSLPINLKGYHALCAAIDQLGLTRDFPRDANGKLTPGGDTRKLQLTTNLSKCLEISVIEKSVSFDLIELRYRGSDPDLGVKLVKQLSENYMRNTSEQISTILAESKTFFTKEAQKRAEMAAKKEAELLQLSLAHPGISPSDPDLLSQRLMAANLAIEEGSARRKELEAKVRSLTEYLQSLNQPGAVPAETPLAATAKIQPNPERLRLEREMDAVKAEIADARALRQMTDNHPHVLGLREKLEHLRSAWEQLPESIAASGTTSVQANVGTDPTAQEKLRVESELKTLNDDIARLDGDLAKRQKEKAYLEEEKGMLFERRQDYLIRQDELQRLKAEARAWASHVDTVNRALTAEEGAHGIRFATVEPAQRPQKPFSPTLGGIFLLSAGIGLALGAAAVFLREILDRTLRDPARIRTLLGIPVLEAIQEIRVGPKAGWLDRRMLLPLLAGAEAVAVAAACLAVYVSVQRPDVYNHLLAGRLPVEWLVGVLGV